MERAETPMNPKTNPTPNRAEAASDLQGARPASRQPSARSARNAAKLAGATLEQGLEDAIATMLALGATRWDALVAIHASGAFPEGGRFLMGVPRFFLEDFPDHKAAIAAFGLWGCPNPEGANAALNGYLDGRSVAGAIDLSHRSWVTSLPKGLRVSLDLDCTRTGLTALPDGLTVGAWLWLGETRITALPDGLTVPGTLVLKKTPLATLPQGLTVNGNLDVTGCSAWDGVIPPDARIRGRIYLDGFPMGITLEDFRKRESA
jgi:hypothetical protein